MNTLFRITLVLAAALLALGGTAAAQERPFSEYLRQLDLEAMNEKAVPRADKAEATLIGAVTFVDDAVVLPDGTPVRAVFIRSRKPTPHEVFVVCAGTTLDSACGRLAIGKRASFTADVYLLGDLVPESLCGEDCEDIVLIVKRLQT